MPYEPNTYTKPTEEEYRSRLYWFVWLSFAANVALLVIYTLDLDIFDMLISVMIGSVIAGLLNGIGFGKSDDYYKALADSGRRWVFAGLIALASLAAFGHLAPKLAPANFWDADFYLISLLGALLYHLGYAYAWVRDNGLSAGEEVR